MKKKALAYNGVIVDLNSLNTGIYADSSPKFYPMNIDDIAIKESISKKYEPSINLETFHVNLMRCEIEVFEIICQTYAESPSKYCNCQDSPQRIEMSISKCAKCNKFVED